MSRLKQLTQYISSVFHVPELVKQIPDYRDHTKIRIPTAAIFLAWLLGFCARVKSREELGRLLDRPALQRLVGGHVSSDSLGRVLAQVDTDGIRTQLLVPVIQTLRRNKAWQPGSIDRMVFAAVDSSEAFFSSYRHCPHCRTRTVRVNEYGQEREVTQYYHQVVYAYIVGAKPAVILDLEPLRPGEDEVAAARRLVPRIARHFGRWLDALIVDAGFAEAPFLLDVRSAGLHFVARIKGDRRLIRDARGLFAQQPPVDSWRRNVGHRRLDVTAWDEEGFTSWESFGVPVRVAAFAEHELPEQSSARRQVTRPAKDRPTAFWATSFSIQQLPTAALWLVGHSRWHIENAGFHQLKHAWFWKHPFVHPSAPATDSPAPTESAALSALLACWLLLAVAVNLSGAFFFRRLQSGPRPQLRIQPHPFAEIMADVLAALRIQPAPGLPCLVDTS